MVLTPYAVSLSDQMASKAAAAEPCPKCKGSGEIPNCTDQDPRGIFIMFPHIKNRALKFKMYILMILTLQAETATRNVMTVVVKVKFFMESVLVAMELRKKTR